MSEDWLHEIRETDKTAFLFTTKRRQKAGEKLGKKNYLGIGF